jgi:hypothetical protein
MPRKVDLFKESIGNNRYLTASVYKDELMVHIREYDNGNGKMYPTRKGASFNKTMWAMFVRHLDDINQSINFIDPSSSSTKTSVQHKITTEYEVINKSNAL